MATNISFNDYSPPEPPKGTIDIRIGVFFDGTQNNRSNSRVAGNDPNNKTITPEEKKAFNKNSNKKDDSYMNDLSNVARKEYHYAKIKYVDSVYVEGIGTDDLGEDSDDVSNHDGVAFGRGDQGIIAKVRKGCELIAEKVLKLKEDDEINIITLDVFGFSRGSAAARNFIYELSKSKYDSEKRSYTASSGHKAEWKVDSHNYKTELDKLPKNGHLGLHLELNKIKYNSIQIRFVGLYDTVSSYDPKAIKTPNYENDVKELHLNSLKLEINGLYKAKKIVHFCAADEHRKNFMLTPTKVAGGKDFYLPGVHSDVGGCYTDKMDEKDVQIMDLDNTWGDGYSDSDYDTILNNDLNNLKEQGWFKEAEVVRPNSWHETFVNRKGIRNIYSYVTLHLMAEKLNKEYSNTIKESIKIDYSIPNKEDANGLNLQKVKERLSDYINGLKPQMKYHTNKDIKLYRDMVKSKQMTTTELNRIIEDHNMLLVLRNKYIHWNSKFGYVTGAYEPNFKIIGKTIARTRKIEPNS